MERKIPKNQKGYIMEDITSTAAALYDGAWRAEDRDELIAEYDLTEEEADAICEFLREFEDIEDV